MSRLPTNRKPGPRTFAVVPVKRLALAKQRLSAELGTEQRRTLVIAMLGDLIGVIGAVPAIAKCLVVTCDPEVAQIARQLGADVTAEPEGADLNGALAHGLRSALTDGCERALILPADVPLVTPTEIEAVLAAAGADGLAIAPDARREGTNALVLPLPAPFQPRFGAQSFAAHLELARSQGLALAVIEREGLAHDIDLPGDLDLLDATARFADLAIGRHGRLSATEALAIADVALPELLARAEAATLAGFGTTMTYSRKVFIPLTQLCRDVCHYCTFAHTPRHGTPAFLTTEQVLEIAQAGAAQGCKEALFTLGDKPELRYRAAREALDALGYDSTLDYLHAMAGLVLKETGLLPHINAGIMDEAQARHLKAVSASQGLMLETISDRLSERGGPHFGSPDKVPAVRLEAIAAAGRAGVPYTTGLLIGIGETRAERIEALLRIRDLHDSYGHIQEVIIQNFRAKPGTRMADTAEPSLDEHLWSIAAARLILGPHMSVQAPPNLHKLTELSELVRAGVNDWGGVSPVTPDHVNPEAPWPHLEKLAEATRAAGRTLAERLAIAPKQAGEAKRWLAPGLITPVLQRLDSSGFARVEDWAAGDAGRPPPQQDIAAIQRPATPQSATVGRILDAALEGRRLGERDVAALFAARGDDFAAVCQAADQVRRMRVGDDVTYVVNRNINYTNICTYGCKFCAFSKGRLSANTRDKPYDLDLEEVAERTRVAWARGATEVCLQGGIAPKYTGNTYLAIVEAVKIGAPDIHVHAFSPLEVWHGAETLGLDLRTYLARLRDQGLSSLPGTAAEILDDEVRRVLCPDKIGTDQWIAVMEAAHAVGLKSTATIMFGHIDRPIHWARHLIRVRDLQERTGGFTELVPLAFVHMESPIYLRGQARKGPTFREAVLMHAVGRLVLDPLITNIQASWVKLGMDGAAACLAAGANDIGGTLMNESITRAAGAAHGQEMLAAELEAMIEATGRVPRQRATFYGAPPPGQRAVALADRGDQAGTAEAAE